MGWLLILRRPFAEGRVGVEIRVVVVCLQAQDAVLLAVLVQALVETALRVVPVAEVLGAPGRDVVVGVSSSLSDVDPGAAGRLVCAGQRKSRQVYLLGYRYRRSDREQDRSAEEHPIRSQGQVRGEKEHAADDERDRRRELHQGVDVLIPPGDLGMAR
jgi:hypothetical protein